jgi:hypothetical protein
MEVKGVGKNEPIITNDKGGMQARVLYGFHLCDPKAMLALAEVMQYGATKYARDNWRKISCEEHINHAFTRGMMAVATQESEE